MFSSDPPLSLSRQGAPFPTARNMIAKAQTKPTLTLLLQSFVLVCLITASARSAEAQFGKATRTDVHEGEALVLDSVGEWETDEDGNEFRIVKIDKRNRTEGRHYSRIDDKTIRGGYGIPIHFFREDDNFFWVRESKPEGFVAQTPEPPAEAPPEPEEEQPAQWRIAFEEWSSGLPTRAQWRNGFLFADMNGDGRLDLVHGPPRKSSPVPHIFLQQKDRSWKRWRIQLPPIPFDYGDIEAADFNADGHLDLALAMHIRGGMVLLGDGKGTFRRGGNGISYRENLNDPAWTGRSLASADFDRDGDMDLVYIGEGMEPPGLREKGTRRISGASGAVIYVNQAAEPKGDQAMDSWEALPLRSAAFGDSVEVGDLENDGWPEIAHANKMVRGSTALWRFDPSAGEWISDDLAIARPATVNAVAFANVDGQPGDEVVTAITSRVGGVLRQVVSWHERAADGTWVGHEIFATKRQGTFYAVTSGDLDGDANTDLVVGTDEAELLMFRGMGEGRFEMIENNLTQRTIICGARFVQLEDLDGDGRDELTVSFAGESSTVAGVGTFPGCRNEGSIHVWSPQTIEAIDASEVSSEVPGDAP